MSICPYSFHTSIATPCFGHFSMDSMDSLHGPWPQVIPGLLGRRPSRRCHWLRCFPCTAGEIGWILSAKWGGLQILHWRLLAGKLLAGKLQLHQKVIGWIEDSACNFLDLIHCQGKLLEDDHVQCFFFPILRDHGKETPGFSDRRSVAVKQQRKIVDWWNWRI